MADDVKLIVFDCDGTIVDSQHMILEAMSHACEKSGLKKPDAEAVRRVVGLSLFNAVKSMMPNHDDELITQLVADYRDAFQELRLRDVEEPLYNGARESFKTLEDMGYILGIATGKSGRGLRKTIENHGIAEHFVTIQTADGNPSKPHPEMLEKAMAEAGAKPSNTIMVGDTSFDMEMSRNALVRPLGVSWGYHPSDELSQAGACVVADMYDDIAPLVERILAGEYDE